ncbi:MAG: hypothetical protein FJ164_08895 [Gammaproteobacteria bacterium]|nr:hypothetical protein [Gammaproteobacteria bacterium]
MLQTFESLIRASGETLVEIFLPLRERVQGQGAARRTQLAQLLGVNEAQLVCGVGFNPNFLRVRDLGRFLGYPTSEGVINDRNFLFIHDRYRELSVNDVVEVYAALGSLMEIPEGAADLVISRLASLEAQVEETINPVLINGYKLEVLRIYQNRLATPALVNTRLGAEYAVMRSMTGEALVMLEQGVVSVARFLRHAGISAEEKTRAATAGLLPVEEINRYLSERPEAPEAEALRRTASAA